MRLGNGRSGARCSALRPWCKLAALFSAYFVLAGSWLWAVPTSPRPAVGLGFRRDARRICETLRKTIPACQQHRQGCAAALEACNEAVELSDSRSNLWCVREIYAQHACQHPPSNVVALVAKWGADAASGGVDLEAEQGSLERRPTEGTTAATAGGSLRRPSCDVERKALNACVESFQGPALAAVRASSGAGRLVRANPGAAAACWLLATAWWAAPTRL